MLTAGDVVAWCWVLAYAVMMLLYDSLQMDYRLMSAAMMPLSWYSVMRLGGMFCSVSWSLFIWWSY